MSKDALGNEIPWDIEETLCRLGEQVRDTLLETDNPAIVCAIISAVLDTWAEEYGYNAIQLASNIVTAMMVVGNTEEE